MKPTLLPRADLREKAFRKYEPFLTQALAQPEGFWNPSTAFERPIRAATFISRFRDAALALRRYHYKTSIPQDATFDHIVLAEDIAGNVFFVNTRLNPTDTKQSLAVADKAAIIDLFIKLEGELRGQCFLLTTASQEEVDWLVSTAKDYDVALTRSAEDQNSWSVI